MVKKKENKGEKEYRNDEDFKFSNTMNVIKRTVNHLNQIQNFLNTKLFY